MALYLAGEEKADALLSENPFALIVGMILDQQIPLERAFSAPLELRNRLKGKIDAKSIAKMDVDKLIAAFVERPALHRFPAAMAERVHEAARIVVEKYKGDASNIWTSATTGEELIKNVRSLPGFGEQKAKIFVALLGKQMGIRPPGWDKVAGHFASPGTTASIADIDSFEARLRVREYKRDMKAAAKASAESSPQKATTARPAK
jgi:uncharacterized HhH-GPD family protein